MDNTNLTIQLVTVDQYQRERAFDAMPLDTDLDSMSDEQVDSMVERIAEKLPPVMPFVKNANGIILAVIDKSTIEDETVYNIMQSLLNVDSPENV